jgi:hypothetical protein
MKTKDAVVPLCSLALLALVTLLLRDYRIREQIDAKTAFYVQAAQRYDDVVERMHRLSGSPGSDLGAFQEIADSELRHLMRLDEERRALCGELWLPSVRR